MRILTAQDVSSILRGLDGKGARQLLDSLSAGLISYSKERVHEKSGKKIHQPARTVFKTAKQDVTLVMPVSDSFQTTVKTVTVPSSGDIAGAVTIFEPQGQLRGVLNAAEITAFRTALAVMTVLMRWPAPEKTKVVVFGAGKQVEWHVRLLLLLLPSISSVTVINRGQARLKALEKGTLAELKSSYPTVSFTAIAKEHNANYDHELATSLKDGDVICCCTPSREPLFTSGDIPEREGRPRFLSLIGSYTPEMQEIDTTTVKASHTIFVDSKEACLSEAGELIRAERSEKDLVEIGQWLGQSHFPSVDSQALLTVVKCVGFGLMDLVVSTALLEMAESEGIGLIVKDF